jgi:two-component system CheB/CheR fusion protein
MLLDITERRRLERELIDISESERRTFGQDLHDGLGQVLTGLEMLSHGLTEDLKSKAPALAKQAQKLNRELRGAVTQARLISHSLAPVPMQGEGLMQGLMQLAASTSRIPKVVCRFLCDPPVLIHDVATATHLYRIAQEAVNNALKHGRAKQIRITLAAGSEGVTLAIENNGDPMRAATHEKRGMGLNVMRYRAGSIGGTLSIESIKRKGVSVTCTLPSKK